MANNSPSSSSLLPIFLIFTILLAVTQVTVAGQKDPTKEKVADKKQPESFIGSDGSVLIPGIGRVQEPALSGSSFFPPYSGLGGGVGIIGGIGGESPSYVPGGDDTYVPNPGVGVPSGGDGVPDPQTADRP